MSKNYAPMKLCFQSNLNAWSSKRAEAVPIRVTNNNNNSMLFIIVHCLSQKLSFISSVKLR